MQKHSVFISHSSDDKEFAESVAQSLKIPDLSPWIDKEVLISGDDILDVIGEGLGRMDILLFLISKSSLESEWVSLELKYSKLREIQEKKILILPFIIDNTSRRSLPWFLQIRHVPRIQHDRSGIDTVLDTLKKALQPRQVLDRAPDEISESTSTRPEIDRILEGISVGDWARADQAALVVIQQTDPYGSNALFHDLLEYQDLKDEDDRFWAAMLVIESCTQLLPQLAERPILARMAEHPNFTVRSTAASICMDMSNFAPSKVPTDIVIKLAVHYEDWYVQAPVTAALKTLAAGQPAVLRVFYDRLASDDPDCRAHAANAIRDIAHKEPDILDLSELVEASKKLAKAGDVEAVSLLGEALPLVKKAGDTSRFKYGI